MLFNKKMGIALIVSFINYKSKILTKNYFVREISGIAHFAITFLNTEICYLKILSVVHFVYVQKCILNSQLKTFSKDYKNSGRKFSIYYTEPP